MVYLLYIIITLLIAIVYSLQQRIWQAETYHFENTLPVIVDGNNVTTQSFPELGNYAQVNLFNSEQGMYIIDSIDRWSGYVIISEGNSLHAGTSMNGGTFLIQSSNNATVNSTMFSLYGDSFPSEELDFTASTLGGFSIVKFGEFSIINNRITTHILVFTTLIINCVLCNTIIYLECGFRSC